MNTSGALASTGADQGKPGRVVTFHAEPQEEGLLRSDCHHFYCNPHGIPKVGWSNWKMLAPVGR